MDFEPSITLKSGFDHQPSRDRAIGRPSQRPVKAVQKADSDFAKRAPPLSLPVNSG
jgi:hypothetical protein